MPTGDIGQGNGSTLASEAKSASIDLAQEARQAATEVVDDVKSTATGIVDEARTVATELAEEAKMTTAEIVQRVRETVQEQIQTRSQELAQRATGNGQDMQEIAEHLRSQGHEVMATFMETEASMFNRLGEYLDNADMRRVIDDLGAAAKKQPLVAAATAFTLGLAGARFLKASSERPR